MAFGSFKKKQDENGANNENSPQAAPTPQPILNRTYDPTLANSVNMTRKPILNRTYDPTIANSRNMTRKPILNLTRDTSLT